MSQRLWKTSNRRQPRHHRPSPSQRRPASPSELGDDDESPRSGGASSSLASLGLGSAVDGDGDGDDRTLTDVDSLLKEIVESSKDEETKEGGAVVVGDGAPTDAHDIGGNSQGSGGEPSVAHGDDRNVASDNNGNGGGSGSGSGHDGAGSEFDNGRAHDLLPGVMFPPSANASAASGSCVSSQLFSSSFPEPSSLGSGSAPGMARLLTGRAGSIGNGGGGTGSVHSRGGSLKVGMLHRRASGPNLLEGGGGGGGKMGTLSPDGGGDDGEGLPAMMKPTEMRRSSSEPLGMGALDALDLDDDDDDLAGGGGGGGGENSTKLHAASPGGGGNGQNASFDHGGGMGGRSVSSATAYRNADGPVIYAHDDDSVSQITSSLAGNTYATMGSSYYFGAGGGGFNNRGAAPSPGAGASASGKKTGGGDASSFAASMDEIAILLKQQPDASNAAASNGHPSAAPQAAPPSSGAVAAAPGGVVASSSGQRKNASSIASGMYSARYKKGGGDPSSSGGGGRERRESISTEETSRRRNSFPMTDLDGISDDDDDNEGNGSKGEFGGAIMDGASSRLPPVVKSAIHETMAVLQPFLVRMRPVTAAAQRGLRAAKRRLPKAMHDRHKKDDDDAGFGTGIPEIDAIGANDSSDANETDYFSMLMSPNFVNRPPAHLRLTPEQKRARTIYAGIKLAGLVTILLSSCYVVLGMVSSGVSSAPRDGAVDAAHFLGNAGDGEEEDPLEMGDDAIGGGGDGGQASQQRKVPKVRGGMAHHRAARDAAAEQFEGGADPLERLAVDEAVKRDLAREGVGVALPPIFDALGDVDDIDGLETGHDLPFFWHIPRTGGATMNDVLGGCLYLTMASDAGGTDGHGEEATLQVIKFPRHFSYVNVDTSNSAGIARARNLGLAASGLADVAVSSLLHEAMTLFPPSKSKDVIKGRMFTLFRHPIDRAVSLFHFLQDTQWKEGPLSSLTMDDYFRGGMAENNWMVRFLTDELTKGELDEDDLELAKEVLRRKCLVGLLGEKTESFARFERYFNWELRSDADRECHEKKVQWAWPLKHKHDDVEEGTDLWSLILEHNVFDVQLFEYAKLLFEEQGRMFQ